MRDNNNSGCGLITSLLGPVFLVFIFLGRNADILTGCGKSMRYTDDWGRVVNNTDNLNNFGKIHKSRKIADLEEIGILKKREIIGNKENLSGVKEFLNLMEMLENLEVDLNLLIENFGEESSIVEMYKSAAEEETNLEAIRKSLLSKEFQELKDLRGKVKGELYGLLNGISLNEKQAEILTEITETNICATPIEFNKYAIIEKEAIGYKIYSTQSIKYASESEVLKYMHKVSDYKLILKGEISKNIIQKYKENNTDVNYSFDAFVNNLRNELIPES